MKPIWKWLMVAFGLYLGLFLMTAVSGHVEGTELSPVQAVLTAVLFVAWWAGLAAVVVAGVLWLIHRRHATKG